MCGITNAEDALAASALGVDALGFVFYKPSPRYICPEDAAIIIQSLPPFVSAVGLFVNPTQSEIDNADEVCRLDMIQLHGDEDPDFCAGQTIKVMKAIAIDRISDIAAIQNFECTVLLDAKAPQGVYGGTGQSFDWSLLHDLQHDYPLILAGGLNASNVGRALRERSWYGVDVSSGIETAPGVKSPEKMQSFCQQVYQIDEDKHERDV